VPWVDEDRLQITAAARLECHTRAAGKARHDDMSLVRLALPSAWHLRRPKLRQHDRHRQDAGDREREEKRCAKQGHRPLPAPRAG
jgi:hypothetical protein